MWHQDLTYSRDEFSNKLTIDIDGPYFPLEKFQKVIENFQGILSELDRTISGTGKPGIEWSISSISSASIHLTAEANLISDEIEHNRASQIITTFVRGLEILQEKPERPTLFNNRALSNARAFSEMLDPENFAEIEFRSDFGRIQVTSSISSHVDEIIQDYHTSYGSIEGQLVSISLANQQSLGIRDFLDNKIIRCYFPDHIFEIAKDALGKRVYVFGKIRQRTHGPKVNITVEELKVLPDSSELPSLMDIFHNIRGES
ncbi:OB-fold nucleic acid binding domain-containing protein [Halotia branconii]|uniref:OB-fold nucleic acid binding domain-containing protein n=1 Tax=Halotia branconii CENA392 TaxID=1539056 RepID=A0AAJ6PAL9_9CYAN|nr:OB-fold nucleic acid binding domain-containing protein [Halotia branconii]WGV27014.1 OB-fold nucleic acid binding domain-containing protein [Halotia branconii CENA392]